MSPGLHCLLLPQVFLNQSNHLSWIHLHWRHMYAPFTLYLLLQLTHTASHAQVLHVAYSLIIMTIYSLHSPSWCTCLHLLMYLSPPLDVPVSTSWSRVSTSWSRVSTSWCTCLHLLMYLSPPLDHVSPPLDHVSPPLDVPVSTSWCTCLHLFVSRQSASSYYALNPFEQLATGVEPVNPCTLFVHHNTSCSIELFLTQRIAISCTCRRLWASSTACTVGCFLARRSGTKCFVNYICGIPLRRSVAKTVQIISKL